MHAAPVRWRGRGASYRFGGASTPVAESTAGDRRSPRIGMAATAAFSSLSSEALKVIERHALGRARITGTFTLNPRLAG